MILESEKEQLLEIHDECKEIGWDGYDAKPISEVSLKNTLTLLDLLPEKYNRPTFGMCPTGSVSIEWYSDATHILTISVEDTMLVFSMLYSTDNICGQLSFTGTEIPDPLLWCIGKIQVLK